MSESAPTKELVEALHERLTRAIPEPRCELDHRDAWQLLVATILSAQSTDKRVNMVTPELFRRWPTPADLAEAPIEDLEEVVRTTGFFRQKSRTLRKSAQRLLDDFDGQVPRKLSALTTLPGVARKTANVVLGTAYAVPSGIVVDTHVSRVSWRLGLTGEKKPDRIERDLCDLWPRDQWIDTGHRLLLHGRYVCKARQPTCAACPLNELCPGRDAPPEGGWEERAKGEQAIVQGVGFATSDGGDQK